MPGAFYRRELPCLLALLDRLAAPPSCILVDGHATLGAAAKPGLGAVLFDALGGGIPVVGIAKTAYRGTPAEAEVLRGRSIRPLYVTSVGMDASVARDGVRQMHGASRIPTLLRLADQFCRAAT